MENINLGVILEPRQEKDLIFGANERVSHVITLENKYWFDYYSPGELQKGIEDTMACVIFSAIKILSAHMNYLIATKQLSIGKMEWLNNKGYINEKGQFDAAERFTTAMSGTTEKGNTGGAVWWSIRNHGVIPQSICQWNGASGDWFRDKANITQEMIDLGKEFVKRFDITYERVDMTNEEIFQEAFKHSPIQVFIPTACPYSGTIQQYCNAEITHAVSKCGDKENNYVPLFDHYIKQPQEIGNKRFIRRVVENYKVYQDGYICNVSENLDIDEDGTVVLEDRNGRKRFFPIEFIKTIFYLLFKRGFKIASMKKYFGSSVDSEKVALTIKGLLLTLIPIIVMVATSVNVTLNPDDLVSFVNTLFGIFTSCITLYGIGRKIYYSIKKN